MQYSTENFPPYGLMQRDFVAEGEEKNRKLERLYQMSHDLAWDGEKVLAELMEKHGGIHLSEEKKQAVGRIFSIILWGELAAWNVSADIALALEDMSAKKAATGQAFDEARHFYTMRDYLRALEIELPPLDWYTWRILTDLLDTQDLILKILGMQLMVEAVAVNLFRMTAKSGVEPVLAELMPYFERDEARHIGLGALFLPDRLKGLGSVQIGRIVAFQFKILTFLTWGTVSLKEDFAAVGIDVNEAMWKGLRLQFEILDELREAGTTRGIYMGPDWLNRLAIDYFFPPKNWEVPFWQKACHGVMERVADAGEWLLSRTRRNR